MENKKSYKIYCLKNNKTGEIRYVGVTTNYLSARKSQHKYNALKKKSLTKVSNWILSLHRKGIDFDIELIETVDIHTWQEREKYWIKQYKNLTNISEGGRGIVLERPNEGRQRSIEAHQKAIILLDFNFNIVREFSSVGETAKFLGLANRSTAVSNALNGFSKSCKGYIPMYKNKYLNKEFTKEDYKHLTWRLVYQYSLNKELITVYENYSDFCRQNNLTKNTPSTDNILLLSKPYKNFLWSYNSPEIFSK